MNPSTPFFSFDLRQPINQWICIALISLMCFWVVLFYFVNRTEAFGNNLASGADGQTSSALTGAPVTGHH